MLFYGDGQFQVRTRERIGRLGRFLREIPDTRDREAIRSLLRSALLEAGELAQGVHDEALARGAGDGGSPAGRLADSITLAFARALDVARTGGSLGAVGPVPLAALASASDLPEVVSVRVPEGFAFYGVTPDTFLEAGHRLRLECPGLLIVLGVRSIGTALGAAVAAAAGGDVRFRTVRPIGHPYEREVVLDESFAGWIRACAGRAWFAVVDEGPGLSGSSFGAVAGALEGCGIGEDRIVFLPAHAGAPGPRASQRNRARWSRSKRFVVSFEEAFLSGEPPPLERAVEDLTGPWDDRARDIGAGGWRELVFGSRERWPAVAAQQERRKYLVVAGGQPWLLKAAGLGRYGEEKLALARALERLVAPVERQGRVESPRRRAASLGGTLRPCLESVYRAVAGRSVAVLDGRKLASSVLPRSSPLPGGGPAAAAHGLASVRVRAPAGTVFPRGGDG